MSIRGDGTTTDMAEDISDLLLTITTMENRILRLVREGDREIPFDDLANEFALLSRDLQRSYRRIVDLAERRDLSFTTLRKLHRLGEQCVWLYRKAQRELAFFKKLRLERQLRTLISDDAFSIYQQLLCAEDEERRLTVSDETAMAARLLAEPADLAPR